MRGDTIVIETEYIFISIYDANYSRSGALLNGLKELNSTHFYKINGMNFRNAVKLTKEFRKYKNKTFVVMSPNQYFVLYLRMCTRSRIVLDSGWSLYEAEISRSIQKTERIRRIKLWLIDSISGILSDKIVVESRAQKYYYQKTFRIHESKLIVGLTGFNEARSKMDLTEKLNVKIQNLAAQKNKPIILFRGKLNAESGIDVLVQTLRQGGLNEYQTVIVTNQKILGLQDLKNVLVIDDLLSERDLAEVYRISDIALGQLSAHPRLSNTVPHKIYEAAYFGVPIVSAASTPVSEILGGIGISYFEGGNCSEFERAVKLVLTAPTLKSKGLDLQNFYRRSLSNRVIAENFTNLLE